MNKNHTPFREIFVIMFKIYSIVIILFLLGCSSNKSQLKSLEFTPFRRPVTLSVATEELEKKPWEYEIPVKERVKDDEKKDVPDKFVYPEDRKRPEPALLKPQFTGDKIDVAFNFDNAEIRNILNVVLGEILNVSYIVDNRVGGRCNLHITGRVYKEELLSMLNTILSVYNFAIIKEDNIYRILPRPDARQETDIVIVGDKIPPWSKDIIIQVVPLEYESARNLQATLRPFLSNIGNIVFHADSQFIILIESASNIGKLLTLIKTFDSPFFAGKAVKFYDFKYVDARNMAKDLSVFIQSLGGKVGAEGGFNFIPFSDTNKMIVVTRVPDLLPKIDYWIKNVDIPPTVLDEEPKIYVYKVQHQKAEEIVPVLTQIYSEKMTAQPKVPGREQQEEMRIVADPKTNSIVVKALPSDYRGIRAIIEAIDSTPLQVFIEALVLEVDLRDDLDYGAQWAINSRSLSGNVRLGGMQGGSNILPAAGIPFFQYARGNFELLLEILAVNSNARILSAPNILVRAGQSANIQVGEEVPVLTSTGQQTGTTVTFEQIQYRPTGIILTVTPHIAENGFITLDIKQEVSDAQQASGTIRSPTFTTRQAETSLVIKSGHTISLGGIIEQKNEKSTRKIPVLGDIPFLGNAFKTISVRNRRTELIMLITPHVASTAEEADTLTDAFIKKLREIEPILSRRDYGELVDSIR
ncbi:MAG: type II secretion system secretin GspD [Candidatus Loosdrechtia sp.]|uniref:type II secretion system secretin GspD n=1 Tax=Candidatus Loosdrechtia sp. TaxID=3101272 RepID=UPI003A7624D6|nr:MAG: type II secretion system secretin GspD [Candidatus Jettenia sp. AMX2]